MKWDLLLHIKEWYFQFGLILIITCASAYISNSIIYVLSKIFKEKSYVKKVMLESLKLPLITLISGFGIILSLQILDNQFHFAILGNLGMFKGLFTLSILLWYLLSIIEKTERHLLLQIKHHESKLDITTISAFSKIAKGGIIILILILGMDTVGINISGIIAFGGIGGIVVGMASKDLLSNIFGAFTIYFDQPFKIGEYINMPKENIEGYIKKIGLRCTIIKTVDKRPLYVPNSIFTNSPIENISRMTHRQILEVINIRHEDFDLAEHIIEEIKAYLLKADYIDPKKSCCVNITGYTLTSINITIRCYSKILKFSEFCAIKEKVLINARRIIKKNHGQLAYTPAPQSAAIPAVKQH